MQGGYIWPGDSYPLNAAGQQGYYRSSRAYSSTGSTYILYLDNSYVNPSYSYRRYGGYSLRCLIPTT